MCGSSAEDEEAGLDIVEHGMYGYPEQFIPQSELRRGLRAGRRTVRPDAPRPAPAPRPEEVTA